MGCASFLIIQEDAYSAVAAEVIPLSKFPFLHYWPGGNLQPHASSRAESMNPKLTWPVFFPPAAHFSTHFNCVDN